MYSTFEKTWEERIVIPFRQFVRIELNELRGLLEAFIDRQMGGKCNEYGYMVKKSARVLKHTSAKIEHEMVSFYVTICAAFFNCQNGEEIKMSVNSITQIGIKGVCPETKLSPYMVYIPIEFIDKNSICEKTGLPLFKQGDIVNVKIEATRFNIGDTMITCIGKYETKEVKKVKRNVVVKKKTVKTYDSDSEED